MSPETDLVVIGGGPAGLTTAIYGTRMGLQVTVFEAESVGGAARTAKTIENYPGFQSITGDELSEKMRAHAEHCGASIIFDTVIDIKPSEMLVITTKDEWKTKAIIITTGSKRKKLGISKEKDLEGYGLSYCATCDGQLYRNKVVAIVGGGDTVAHDAIYLSGLVRKVHLIHDGPKLDTSEELTNQVMVQSELVPMFNSSIEEVISKEFFDPKTQENRNKVSRIVVKNHKTGYTSELRVKALFVALGEDPFKLAKLAEIETDASGSIVVNHNQETNIEGIYAAGDVTGGVKQIGTAVGEGIVAAMKAGFYAKRKIRKEKEGQQS